MKNLFKDLMLRLYVLKQRIGADPYTKEGIQCTAFTVFVFNFFVIGLCVSALCLITTQLVG
jgi:hypothetical protein